MEIAREIERALERYEAHLAADTAEFEVMADELGGEPAVTIGEAADLVADPSVEDDYEAMLLALDAQGPDDDPPPAPGHTGATMLPEEHYNAALWESGGLPEAA
jgi:hypothetical protein